MHLKPKSRLPVTHFLVTQSFWNFAQNMGISLSLPVQNFPTEVNLKSLDPVRQQPAFPPFYDPNHQHLPGSVYHYSRRFHLWYISQA